MSIESEKLERFSQAVDEEVDSQIQQIIDEAEASKKDILEKANDSSLYIAYDKIKEEIKSITSKYLKIVSKAELDSKRDILLYREEISKSVIENVKSRLIDFTASAEYKNYLIKVAKSEISNSAGEEVIIYLSAGDMKYENDLCNSLGGNISVKNKNNIKIGGLSVYFKNSNILTDKTFDSALQEQKDLFNNSSSLRLS